MKYLNILDTILSELERLENDIQLSHADDPKAYSPRIKKLIEQTAKARSLFIDENLKRCCDGPLNPD